MEEEEVEQVGEELVGSWSESLWNDGPEWERWEWVEENVEGWDSSEEEVDGESRLSWLFQLGNEKS